MEEILLTGGYGQYPIIYKASYMLGGCLGFLPSMIYFPTNLPSKNQLNVRIGKYISPMDPIG